MSNTDYIKEFVEDHIKYIRRMSMLDDVQLRALLTLKVTEDPSIIEKFIENKAKKNIDDIRLMARDIQKDDSTKIARKVA